MIGFSDYKTFEPKNEIALEDNLVIDQYEDVRFYLESSLSLVEGISIIDSKNIIFDGQSNVITIEQLKGITFANCENVKICNLTIIGAKIGDKNGAISIECNNSTHILFENCTFIDGADEQISIKECSDYFTISNCRFEHLENTPHKFAILIGKSEFDVPKSGHYHVTIYQCYFNGGVGRYPRFRHGIIHLLNCIWDKKCSRYLIGPELGKMYIDSCFVLSEAKFIKRFDHFKFNVVNTDVDVSKLKEYIDENIQKPDYTYTVITLKALAKKLNVVLEK